MAASTRRSSGPVLRSVSPSGKFYRSSSSSSAFASSTASTFIARSSSALLRRSASPTPVNLCNSASSVQFPLEQSISPNHSIAMVKRNSHVVQKSGRNTLPAQKRTCMCSPTNHPGSFRCSLHKSISQRKTPYQTYRLNTRRSAMTNSLVRIGTVEGDFVKRALATLIRPSSHQQRRRGNFQPRPSRLSLMSRA